MFIVLGCSSVLAIAFAKWPIILTILENLSFLDYSAGVSGALFFLLRTTLIIS